MEQTVRGVVVWKPPNSPVNPRARPFAKQRLFQHAYSTKQLLQLVDSPETTGKPICSILNSGRVRVPLLKPSQTQALTPPQRPCIQEDTAPPRLTLQAAEVPGNASASRVCSQPCAVPCPHCGHLQSRADARASQVGQSC